MTLVQFVVPSSVNSIPATLVKQSIPALTPKICVPVIKVDRCVCCPDDLIHGMFCRVTYKYARMTPDGVAQYTRWY